MSPEEFNSLCPGDVVLTNSNPDLATQYQGVQKILVTRKVGDIVRCFCLGVKCASPASIGPYPGLPDVGWYRKGPYSGLPDVGWYRKELDCVVSRGSEYYRKNK